MGSVARVAALPPCEAPQCEREGRPEHLAAYDARLGNAPGSPWAYVCERAFRFYGCSLGTGWGQRLLADHNSLDKPDRSG